MSVKYFMRLITIKIILHIIVLYSETKGVIYMTIEEFICLFTVYFEK